MFKLTAWVHYKAKQEDYTDGKQITITKQTDAQRCRALIVTDNDLGPSELLELELYLP